MRAILIESRELAPEVRHFVFEAEERLTFEPGQFVPLTHEIGGKPITRAYSLANAPRGDNRFELCLNLVHGGKLSPHLFSMQPGDAISMQPPLGGFVIRDPARDQIWIATGTGIAPFRSFWQAHIQESTPDITLLFGTRYATHILYSDECEALAARLPRFHYWPTLTRAGDDWAFRTGRVQQHLEQAIAGRTELDFYLCGLKEMVDQVRSILKTMGFDRKQIRYEKYDQ